MEYTLALALVDFLPVVFTGAGFLYLIRLVSFVLPSQGTVALWGSVLVLAGGFFKAVWKLLMASSGGNVDIRWMEEGLFIFMAPGYILLAWSIWQTARSVQGKRILNPWMFPVGLIMIMLLGSYSLFRSSTDSPAWERVLLTILVLSTLLTEGLLIAFALRLRLYGAGVLFLINLLAIFLLNGMARLPEQPITIQWIEETINTISWLAFALGARIIYEYARKNFGLDSSLYRAHLVK